MNNFQLPKREQNSNKGTFGKVLNVAGSNNYIGAAYLSSLSALKIGAGYAALVSDSKIIDSVSKLLPESVFLSRRDGLKNFDKFSVLLIGCGLGQGFLSKYYFKRFLRKALINDIPTVIDADGLNILSKSKNLILPKNTVITPHPAEAARLLGVEANDVLVDIANSAKLLSQKYKCTTVLKSHRTVVCSQQGEIYINQFGNSSLAKAGTGDVLAGMIAGLIAQKMNIFDAAKLGVYIHSKSGEAASKDLTEYSVLAADLPKYFPIVIKELLI